jgi:hypothetical protein
MLYDFQLSTLGLRLILCYIPKVGGIVAQCTSRVQELITLTFMLVLCNRKFATLLSIL